ncbi:hypothetical protein N431DRAFT_17323 [Stipitochalara longipes BDJ]|nr:hypothetical protein N431DRAFT_17323 [Stipitochalara longipes BDJ]
MNPLSITAGVLGLLGTCVKVGSTLKDFYDGASFADTKVKGLLTDVEIFTQVLQLMKITFEQDQIRSSIEITGHIDDHWVFLATSIQDVQNTLLQLQGTLERVNKSVNMLDGARKHLRLKSASEEIGNFQLQIRSYRDSLQLSLQTMIFSNQVTLKESTEKVLPNLDEINQAIRRIALDLNHHMRSFQQHTTADPNDSQLLALKNLSNCVQSAASVVSSASTSLGVEDVDHFSVINGSEFGDIFISELGETMCRWISSKSVSEFEGDRGESSLSRRKIASNYLQPVDESTESDQSDSDTDLEIEIVHALLKRGKERFEAKDLEFLWICSRWLMFSSIKHHTPRRFFMGGGL